VQHLSIGGQAATNLDVPLTVSRSIGLGERGDPVLGDFPYLLVDLAVVLIVTGLAGLVIIRIGQRAPATVARVLVALATLLGAVASLLRVVHG